MKQEKIKNDKGEILKTKEGVELVKNTFEVGDEFIPMYNNISEKTKTIVTKKGDQKNITTYKIVVKIKDSSEDMSEKENIWIDLTPAQAETIKKKLDADIEINQGIWTVYEYESSKYGKNIGIGMKRDDKKAINF